MEISKNLNPPLNPQQRNVLMRLLSDTGLPLIEIAKIGRRVMDATTYNTLSYDHWKAEMDLIRFKTPRTEPDRYCVDCDANHKWDQLCPQLDGTDPRPYTERQ